jgi:alkanesulfonate monooxygenase SsuD/methylene tetrahydromethanopterin reductase-like flavin-dependent oxidoreductase (luciferase family)
MTMRYGVHVNSGAAVTAPSVLRDLGQVAEELGYETILIGDGDGWQPVYLPLPMIQQKLGQLRAPMEEAGRDFRQLEITTLQRDI